MIDLNAEIVLCVNGIVQGIDYAPKGVHRFESVEVADRRPAFLHGGRCSYSSVVCVVRLNFKPLVRGGQGGLRRDRQLVHMGQNPEHHHRHQPRQPSHVPCQQCISNEPPTSPPAKYPRRHRIIKTRATMLNPPNETSCIAWQSNVAMRMCMKDLWPDSLTVDMEIS